MSMKKTWKLGMMLVVEWLPRPLSRLWASRRQTQQREILAQLAASGLDQRDGHTWTGDYGGRPFMITSQPYALFVPSLVCPVLQIRVHSFAASPMEIRITDSAIPISWRLLYHRLMTTIRGWPHSGPVPGAPGWAMSGSDRSRVELAGLARILARAPEDTDVHIAYGEEVWFTFMQPAPSLTATRNALAWATDVAVALDALATRDASGADGQRSTHSLRSR